jgi:hypothetical protein
LVEDLSIKVLESTDGKDVVMGFSTVLPGNEKIPLWFIENNEKTVSLEIISNKPLPIVGYNCFVTTERPKDQGSIKWAFQGSNDGQIWTNLDMEANILPLQQAMLTTYPIKDQSFFNRYRFIWNKEGSSERIGVALVKLRFLN